jgi:hypothetical protein
MHNFIQPTLTSVKGKLTILENTMSNPCNILAPCIGGVASLAAISPPAISVATSIGTFFAPATAAAAGGAVNIIAASAAGSLITFIPGALGIVVAGLLLVTGLNAGSEKLINAAIFLGIVDVVATYLLAAKIGAGIAGVATSSVILCNVIGSAVIMLGLALALTVVAAAGAACLSSFAEAVAPGSFGR